MMPFNDDDKAQEFLGKLDNLEREYGLKILGADSQGIVLGNNEEFEIEFNRQTIKTLVEEAQEIARILR